MTILVTGGAGFIGGNFVLDWVAGHDEPVVNLDRLTYAGNLQTLSSLQGNPLHIFVQGDIGDRALVDRLLAGESAIRIWREHRGLTLTALAEMASVSVSYLSEIESGRKPGSAAAIRAVANALRVPMEDLT